MDRVKQAGFGRWSMPVVFVPESPSLACHLQVRAPVWTCP
jgi:hypothetical protein